MRTLSGSPLKGEGWAVSYRFDLRSLLSSSSSLSLTLSFSFSLFRYGEGKDAEADGGADVEAVVAVVAEGTEDGEGAGGCGGSGGDDVVDDEDVFSSEEVGAGAAEDVLYVALALFRGEPGLAFVVDDATDGAGEDGQVGDLTDATGYVVALVVAATELATPMEGDGDDAVDVGEEGGVVFDFLC